MEQSRQVSSIANLAESASDSSVAALDAPGPTPRKSSGLGSRLVRKGRSLFRLHRNQEPQDPDDVTSKKEKGELGLSTLHDPQDDAVIADIIFIHGLGGGSIKTWSASSGDETVCWPQDWLPGDAEFQHVRIHTFGYDADWKDKAPSVLSVLDFAQTLLGEMKNHHQIGRGRTGIIFVCHSMGGCVAKKTYILVREDPACKDLAARVHSMFFLATPHRGSDLGKALRGVLLLNGISKPFVEDLVHNSEPVLKVNETFRDIASGLHLWSFFESLPVFGLTRTVVVSKESATLGLPNEETSYLDADHRRVCKFAKRGDPNYRRVRNALVSAIDVIKFESPDLVAKSILVPYLGIETYYLNDLEMLREAKTPGSCEWVTSSSAFIDWTQQDSGAPPIYWMVGIRGAGKSVMSGHVVGHLQKNSMRCSYFFFRKGTSDSQNLQALLRTLAFQMAMQDSNVLKLLTSMQEDKVSLDGEDRVVWRRLFLDAILKSDSISSHFWVIDGLDEFSNVSEVFRILKQVPSSLRVFFTSRSSVEIDRGLVSLGKSVSVRPIMTEDTSAQCVQVLYNQDAGSREAVRYHPTQSLTAAVGDIRAAVAAGLARLSHLDGIDELSRKIVERSDGSFLWMTIVLKELEKAWTHEDVEEILRQVPDDMNEMYARLLKSIQQLDKQAKLAKSIFTWIILAARPLTVDEMYCAVHLDLDVLPYKMDQVILATCGTLVIIDPSGRVHMLHDTARQFLLDLGGSDAYFAVMPATGNARFATLCLMYLESILGPDAVAGPESALFLRYASEFFSRHLVLADPVDPRPFDVVSAFLDGSVLHWIEQLARRRQLGVAVRTSRDLVAYTRNRPAASLPDPRETSVRLWAEDISRASLAFREPLLQSPVSIHTLIPSFFPAGSAIAQHAASYSPRLLVSPRPSRSDECLLCIEHANVVQVMVCGVRHLAIGSSTGTVSVYELEFLQNTVEMKHPERSVRQLSFGDEDQYLAASGPSDVVIWDVKTGQSVYRFSCGGVSLLYFIGNLFMTMAPAGEMEARYLENGDSQLLQSSNYLEDFADSLPVSSVTNSRLDPTNLAWIGLSFLGHGDIFVLDIVEVTLAKVFPRPGSVGVRDFKFNSCDDPNGHYLAASYRDESLAIFGVETAGRLLFESDFAARELSWSADGRHLLAAKKESLYHIYVYEFLHSTSSPPALNLIHRIRCPGIPFSDLAFACHGQRIFGGHGLATRVWEVPLLRQKRQLTLPSPSGEATEGRSHGRALISAMDISKDGWTVFCGTQDGEIAAYCARSGERLAPLTIRHNAQVNVLRLVNSGDDEARNILITADDSELIVALVGQDDAQKLDISVICAMETKSIVHGVLISPARDRLLLLTTWASELWTLRTKQLLKSLPIPRSSEKLRAAEPCPMMDDSFLLLEGSSIHTFRWHDFEQTPTLFSLSRDGHLPEPQDAVSFSLLRNETLLVEKLTDPLTGARVNCWNAADFPAPLPTGASSEAAQQMTVAPRRGLQPLGAVLGDTIALLGSTLVFVATDRWVCTADLETFAQTLEVRRHFFVLPAWVGLTGRVVARLTPGGDLVFATGEDVTVFGGWMGIWEPVLLEGFDADEELGQYQTEDIWVSSRPVR